MDRRSRVTAPTRLAFTADGDPKPQGSKRAYVVKGRAVLVESAGQNLKDWRSSVAATAHLATVKHGWVTTEDPVTVVLVFRMRAPRKPRWVVPGTRPDIDKLTRSVLDALTTARVWADDSQVVALSACKVYGEPGVEVTVCRL